MGPASAEFAQAPAAKPGSDRLERVAKYIPGEIIAFYILALGILNSVDEGDGLRTPVAWGCLALGTLATPSYVYRLASKWDRATFVNAATSTVAFGVWAYNLGGIFTYQGWYVPWLGSILIGAFTVVSAFIELPQRVIQE
ncbi:MAG: hypothetical protein DWQ37_04150 [Planctomycetota bacterium]|nr:MAG: hypothetical protein DWQ37_04150 [Planctomycetota bacterium]